MLVPLWSLIPFFLVVLCVALLPAFAHSFWKRHGLLILAALSIPVLGMAAAFNYHWVVETFVDYVTFICLLGALYALGGGLLVSGIPKANPLTNIGFLVIGALFSNLIGTLGASMLLIR